MGVSAGAGVYLCSVTVCAVRLREMLMPPLLAISSTSTQVQGVQGNEGGIAAVNCASDMTASRFRLRTFMRPVVTSALASARRARMRAAGVFVFGSVLIVICIILSMCRIPSKRTWRATSILLMCSKG